MRARSSRSRRGSTTGSSTMTRLAAVQRWPVVPKADQRMPSVARSRSASAMTTTAFLPPSSRLTRFSRRAARSAICLPVLVWPVKEMTWTSGLSTSASPTSAPEPVTRLTVPGGKPASAISSTRSTAQWGVSLAGLKTTVLPRDQRRHHLPARDRHREIPGRDDPGDADRLADAHRPLVGQFGRDCIAK